MFTEIQEKETRGAKPGRKKKEKSGDIYSDGEGGTEERSTKKRKRLVTCVAPFVLKSFLKCRSRKNARADGEGRKKRRREAKEPKPRKKRRGRARIDEDEGGSPAPEETKKGKRVFKSKAFVSSSESSDEEKPVEVSNLVSTRTIRAEEVGHDDHVRRCQRYLALPAESAFLLAPLQCANKRPGSILTPLASHRPRKRVPTRSEF